MKVLAAFPPSMSALKRAGHPHHVPIKCDCGRVLAHEHSRGAGTTHGTVICPSCGKTEEVSLQEMCTGNTQVTNA